MTSISPTTDLTGTISWSPARPNGRTDLDAVARYELLKRAVDIVVAGALLIALGPLMLLTALLIKLTSPGPVIFRQHRAGRYGRPFVMLKFRTMYHGAQKTRDALLDRNEQDGPVFKMANDPRLTALGRILRKTSIDELPQLLNVLAGDMSLVGPRPLWLPEANQTVGPARLRSMVKPGLTCLWQISGRSELSYQEWMDLDLYYLQARSMLLDMLIMIQTIPAVLSARGAY